MKGRTSRLTSSYLNRFWSISWWCLEAQALNKLHQWSKLNSLKYSRHSWVMLTEIKTTHSLKKLFLSMPLSLRVFNHTAMHFSCGLSYSGSSKRCLERIASRWFRHIRRWHPFHSALVNHSLQSNTTRLLKTLTRQKDLAQKSLMKKPRNLSWKRKLNSTSNGI